MKSNYSLILFATAFSMTLVTSGYATGERHGLYQGDGSGRTEIPNSIERTSTAQARNEIGTCKNPKFKNTTASKEGLIYELKKPLFSAMANYVIKYKNYTAEQKLEKPFDVAGFQNVFAQQFGFANYDAVKSANSDLRAAIDALSATYAKGMDTVYKDLETAEKRTALAKRLSLADIASGQSTQRKSIKTFLRKAAGNESYINAVDGEGNENYNSMSSVADKLLAWIASCDQSAVDAAAQQAMNPPATPKLKDLPDAIKADKKLAAALDDDKTSPENKDKISDLIAKRDEVLDNPSSNQVDKDKAIKEFQEGVGKLSVGGKVKDELLRVTSHEKQANVLLGTKNQPGTIKVSKDGFSKKLASLKTTNEADSLAKELKDKKAELVDTLAGVDSEIKSLKAKSSLSPDESKLLKRLEAKKTSLEVELDSKNSDGFAKFEVDAQERIKAFRDSLGTNDNPFSSKASESKQYQATRDKMNPFLVVEDNRRNLEKANTEFDKAKSALSTEADADSDGTVSDSEAYEYLKKNPDTITDSSESEKYRELQRTSKNRGIAQVTLSESEKTANNQKLTNEEKAEFSKTAKNIVDNKESNRAEYETRKAAIQKREEDVAELKAERDAKKLLLRKLKKDPFADEALLKDGDEEIARLNSQLIREQRELDKMKENNDPSVGAVTQLQKLTNSTPAKNIALFNKNVAELKLTVDQTANLSLPDLGKVLNRWKKQKRDIVYPVGSSFEDRNLIDDQIKANIKILEEEIARKQMILESLK